MKYFYEKKDTSLTRTDEMPALASAEPAEAVSEVAQVADHRGGDGIDDLAQ